MLHYVYSYMNLAYTSDFVLICYFPPYNLSANWILFIILNIRNRHLFIGQDMAYKINCVFKAVHAIIVFKTVQLQSFCAFVLH